MKMDRRPLPAPFPVGARVEYVGTMTWYKDQAATIVLFGPGMVGMVVAVRPGRRGTLRDLSEPDDMEPVLDTTRDAYSVVVFHTGVRRAVSASEVDGRWVQL